LNHDAALQEVARIAEEIEITLGQHAENPAREVLATLGG
jgi:hypothetical protein